MTHTIRQRRFTPYLAAVAGLMLVILNGCAQLGVPTADTFNQKLAVAATGITGVRNATTTLVTAGKLTPDDAQNIQTQADNARAGLEIARTLAGKDLSAADAKLTASVAVLTALQTYLTAQGAPR